VFVLRRFACLFPPRNVIKSKKVVSNTFFPINLFGLELIHPIGVVLSIHILNPS